MGRPLGLARRVVADLLDDLLVDARRLVARSGRGPGGRARFRAFGAGSAICFPVAALFGERYIELGAGTVVGPYVIAVGGRVAGARARRRGRGAHRRSAASIGKGTGIVGHERIEIGDDVFTGHHVYITDANHGYEDPRLPIGQQFAPPQPGAASARGPGSGTARSCCPARPSAGTSSSAPARS